MPDETITPEQWRAWGENPCTQRLLAKLDNDAAYWNEKAAGARERAIKELDTHGPNLLGERDAMQDYAGAAGTARGYAIAIRKMFEPQPEAEPLGGRRVTVQG